LVALRKIGNVPDFRRWITVLNKDVARFTIKLSGLFKQYENADVIAQRLSDSDPEIRKMAIITLGKLAMPYSVPELRELYLTDNQSNKAEIIISLIMIYDMSNIPFFKDILLSDTESYLRILAARGLRSLDGDGKIHLENIYSNAGDDTLLKNIIIHAKDQRI
jgi:HEAT repeat protein